MCFSKSLWRVCRYFMGKRCAEVKYIYEMLIGFFLAEPVPGLWNMHCFSITFEHGTPSSLTNISTKHNFKKCLCFERKGFAAQKCEWDSSNDFILKPGSLFTEDLRTLHGLCDNIFGMCNRGLFAKVILSWYVITLSTLGINTLYLDYVFLCPLPL